MSVLQTFPKTNGSLKLMIVSETLTVNPGSRITGQVWSQLVASGSYFANLLSPQVMVKVGSKGDVGTMEISDMLFTSKGALPGLVLMEWNIAADEQGSVSIVQTPLAHIIRSVFMVEPVILLRASSLIAHS